MTYYPTDREEAATRIREQAEEIERLKALVEQRTSDLEGVLGAAERHQAEVASLRAELEQAQQQIRLALQAEAQAVQLWAKRAEQAERALEQARTKAPEEAALLVRGLEDVQAGRVRQLTDLSRPCTCAEPMNCTEPDPEYTCRRPRPFGRKP